MTESPRSRAEPLHPLPSALLHDLRTPLNHVIGYTELVMEQAQDAGSEELLPYLEKIRASGHRLLTLMNETFTPVRDTAAAVEESRVEASGLSTMAPDAWQAQPAEMVGSAWGSLLVVDDVEDNRVVLSEQLTRQGYEVGTAENGRQALEMLRGEAFELVLLDIMMPGLDGFEVLRRLKIDERLRHIPVVVISALSDMESVSRCIEMGAEDYLPKPFTAVLLHARVGACLERKRTMDREALLFEQLQQKQHRLRQLEESTPGGA